MPLDMEKRMNNLPAMASDRRGGTSDCTAAPACCHLRPGSLCIQRTPCRVPTWLLSHGWRWWWGDWLQLLWRLGAVSVVLLQFPAYRESPLTMTSRKEERRIIPAWPAWVKIIGTNRKTRNRGKKSNVGEPKRTTVESWIFKSSHGKSSSF